MKKIIKIIRNIIMIIIVFLAIIICVQRISNNEKSFFGFRLFQVQTGSMIPKYQIHDALLAKEKDASKIKVGDDLVYLGEERDYKGKLITHQVISIENRDGKYYYITKGIANSTQDPEVSEDQIYGIVIYKLKILSFMYKLLFKLAGNEYTLLFCLVIPFTLFIFFNIIHGGNKVKKRGQDN